MSLDESRRRFTEGLAQITLLLKDEKVSSKGEFNSFSNVTSLPRPMQRPHPPFWIAATNTPETFAYGMREFAIYDNNGYLLQFGTPVCALLAGGGYAEQVIVPAGQLLHMPDGVEPAVASLNTSSSIPPRRGGPTRMPSHVVSTRSPRGYGLRRCHG